MAKLVGLIMLACLWVSGCTISHCSPPNQFQNSYQMARSAVYKEGLFISYVENRSVFTCVQFFSPNGGSVMLDPGEGYFFVSRHKPTKISFRVCIERDVETESLTDSSVRYKYGIPVTGVLNVSK